MPPDCNCEQRSKTTTGPLQMLHADVAPMLAFSFTRIRGLPGSKGTIGGGAGYGM